MVRTVRREIGDREWRRAWRGRKIACAHDSSMILFCIAAWCIGSQSMQIFIKISGKKRTHILIFISSALNRTPLSGEPFVSFCPFNCAAVSNFCYFFLRQGTWRKNRVKKLWNWTSNFHFLVFPLKRFLFAVFVPLAAHRPIKFQSIKHFPSVWRHTHTGGHTTLARVSKLDGK